MDPVKKEAPVANADQTLIKETGGTPGIGNLEHSRQMRTEIEKSVGVNVTPEAELAENNLGKAEKDSFIEAVAGVKPEGDLEEGNKSPDPDSGLHNLRESISAFSPTAGSDEENVRTASSKPFNEMVENRKAA